MKTQETDRVHLGISFGLNSAENRQAMSMRWNAVCTCLLCFFNKHFLYVQYKPAGQRSVVLSCFRTFFALHMAMEPIIGRDVATNI